MKKLVKSRKGDAFTVVLTLIALSILILILVSLSNTYGNLAAAFGRAGSQAVTILSAYDEADAYLLYLDSAARLSLQKSVYEFAGNGFYHAPSGMVTCGSTPDYVLWSRGSAEKIANRKECGAVLADSCIPRQSNLDFIGGYLARELEPYIQSYNGFNKVFPDGLSHSFTPSRPMGGMFELVGLADKSKPLVVTKPGLHYEVTPSFRESVDVDLIGDFEEITGKIKALTADGELSEGEISSALESYNNAGEGLEWQLVRGSYKRDCSNPPSNPPCYIEGCTVKREEEKCSPVEAPADATDYACGYVISCDDGSSSESSSCYPSPRSSDTICDGDECCDFTYDCAACYFGCSEGVCDSTPGDKCETVTVSEPGELVHKYCTVNAEISVKIKDDRYKVPGEGEGYKKFLTVDSDSKPVAKEYAYKFALNWVEMGSTECVPLD